MSETNGDDSIQLDSRNAAYVEGLLEEVSSKDPASTYLLSGKNTSVGLPTATAESLKRISTAQN